MSRTDNTRPWWLRAYDPYVREAYMDHGCFRGWRHGRRERKCDAHLPTPHSYVEYRARTCSMTLTHFYLSTVPRWYLLSEYHCPERQRARIELCNAARDWNANGDTDIQPEPRQARHGAAWYYW